MKKAIFGILMLFANVSFAATLTGSYSGVDENLVVEFGSNVNNGNVRYYGLDVGDADVTTTVAKLSVQPANTDHDVTYGIAQVNFAGDTVDLSGAAWLSSVNSLTTLLLANTKYVLSVASETASHVTSRLSSTVSAVPLPAAVWLFGSALAGFMALSSRRKV